MRPELLEAEGFTTFSSRVEVDFRDADLFALVGPTGAGKSSVIDAMTFALYGSVPRLDNTNLVAPVISQGKLEARVRLRFAVGAERFDVARVVRRTRTGATTKEARLERVVAGADPEVVAGDAAAVTAAVEALSGLTFAHFTKCVVLPQGEFARFLHDKPSERQALLVKLLELGVYGEMGRRARLRVTDARGRIEAVQENLDKLADATPAALTAMQRRAADLTELGAEIDALAPALETLRRDCDMRKADAAAAARWAAALSITTSVEVAEFARRAAEATERAAAARRGEAEAAAAEDVAMAAVPETPRRVLDDWQRAHADLRRESARQVTGRAAAEAALHAESAAAAELACTVTARSEARLQLDALRLRHSAHEIATALRRGDKCPVCGGDVAEAPAESGDAPAALDAARDTLAKAETAVEASRERERAGGLRRQRVEAELASVAEKVEAASGALAGAPPVEELGALVAAAGAAESALTSARAAARQARAGRLTAERACEALQEIEREMWRAFDLARDGVAALGAPPAERDDLAASWRELTAWAAREAEVQGRASREAIERAAALTREITGADAALRNRCRQSGVEVPARTAPSMAVAEALGRARAEISAIEREIGEATKCRAELADLRRRERVAGELARHLNAKGFEKWLLDEAVHRLLDGASDLLLDLSSGQYSLELDSKTANFQVVDHRNAGERRSARTLSGGETFLASMALALALADQIASLAARGAPGIEALFLDEGFGSLDAETLDVVTTAIEELGARGRMVGLVTHVRELAERVPVRFEVRKGATTSTIERVET